MKSWDVRLAYDVQPTLYLRDLQQACRCRASLNQKMAEASWAKPTCELQVWIFKRPACWELIRRKFCDMYITILFWGDRNFKSKFKVIFCRIILFLRLFLFISYLFWFLLTVYGLLYHKWHKSKIIKFIKIIQNIRLKNMSIFKVKFANNKWCINL